MLALLTKLLEDSTSPIGTVLHIGAGGGSELSIYRELNCEHVIAIEPNDLLFKKLKTKAKPFSNVTVQQAWVADKASERKATTFSNPKLNSLLSASSNLLAHFPDLKNPEILKVKTQAFEGLVTKNVALTTEKLNILVLEVQGFETTILQSCPSNVLQLFDWIIVRTADQVLFDGGTSALEVNQFLHTRSFDKIVNESSQLPFLEQYYRLNSSKLESQTLLSQLASVKKQSDVYLQELKKYKDSNKSLQDLLKKSTAEISSLQHALIDKQNVIISKDRQLMEAKGKFEHLKAEQTALQGQVKEFNSSILEKDKILTTLQTEFLQTNRQIDKGLQNIVKQVQSFIGLQNYLSKGDIPLTEHGRPIGSDMAIMLINKIQQYKYDLIIEFGSGTSTVLIAKTIQYERKRAMSNELGLKHRSSEVIHADADLPEQIITFEHKKKCFDKTLAELEGGQLECLVELIHAPLVEMQVDNETYLYYSCEKKLAHIAANYSDQAVKILVLIGSTPETIEPLARMPAVPMLLNYFGKHQLDIVLDDYNSKEEDTTTRWKQQFDKRGITYDEELIPCEKGGIFLRVNL